MKFEMHPDVTRASTIPSAFYSDPGVYEIGKERIFARSWQWCAWLEQIKVPGSVLPVTVLPGCLDEPVLFTRTRDDEVCCLSNVCTHRGNLVCEGPGVENSLRCRYHGRRFGLDGSFQSMPEFEGVCGFPSSADDLPRVGFSRWRQFYFANLEPAGYGLDEMLAEMEERIGWLPVEHFTFDPDGKRDFLVNGNWALYVDNYLEGFHIPYIHAALNSTLDYGAYRTELLRHGNLQVGFAGGGEAAFDLPGSSPDHGQRIGAYYYWFFPNLMLNFYPWGLSVNTVQPLGPTRTKVSFWPFVWRPELRADGAGGDLDRVEREDEAVVELTQRGVRSRFYDRGRYAPEREKGVHQFHCMIAEAMNRG
ncbi:MAG: aromatic ring-hydroxylating dioxygenase subunit alpha [Armatimonadetes bacterium]|nr:aromatic ring-hydroxylating dioxygenase subunit alpha [Armatimonadota bacterium]